MNTSGSKHTAHGKFTHCVPPSRQRWRVGWRKFTRRRGGAERRKNKKAAGLSAAFFIRSLLPITSCLLLLQRPFVVPFDGEFIAVEGDGEPDVAGVVEVEWEPAVEHGDVDVVLAFDGDDVGALGVVGYVGFGADAGVAHDFPWAHNGVGNGVLGGVGVPAGAAGGKHVVFAIAAEHGGGFTGFVDEVAREGAGGFKVVVAEEADVERDVVFGGVDVVGFAVFVFVEGHVAAHLSVGAHGAEIFEVARGGVAHGNAGGGLFIIQAIDMQPHDELLGLLVVDDFGAFDHFGGVDIGVDVGDIGLEDDAFELPVVQIFG